MSNNRNMPAKPIWNDDMNLGNTAGPGLTKLEYAAIHIFCSGESPKIAVVLANALFDALEAQGDSDD